MRSIRFKFYLWVAVWVAIFVSANFQLREFPHFLWIFWSLLPVTSVFLLYLLRRSVRMLASPRTIEMTHGAVESITVQITALSKFTRLEVFAEDGRKLQLDGRDKSTLTYTVHAPHIGQYAAPKSNLYVSDPMGFFTFYWDVKLPSLLSLPAQSTGKIVSMQAVGDAYRAADPTTVRKESPIPLLVSDRRVGESLRRAHWKLSARLQKWMIRRADDEPEREVTLLLDLPFVSAPVSYEIMETSHKKAFKNDKHDKENDKHDKQKKDKSVERQYFARDHFIEESYRICHAFLEEQYKVTLLLPGQSVVLTRQSVDDLDLARSFARIPFVEKDASFTAQRMNQWNALKETTASIWITADLSAVGKEAIEQYLPLRGYRAIYAPKTQSNVDFVAHHPIFEQVVHWVGGEEDA